MKICYATVRAPRTGGDEHNHQESHYDDDGGAEGRDRIGSSRGGGDYRGRGRGRLVLCFLNVLIMVTNQYLVGLKILFPFF